MKLIIDIPVELAEKGHWYTDEEMWTVIRAAQNGTPLEQIRAEINDVAVKTQNEDKREGLYIAREIVDRHR